MPFTKFPKKINRPKISTSIPLTNGEKACIIKYKSAVFGVKRSCGIHVIYSGAVIRGDRQGLLFLRKVRGVKMRHPPAFSGFTHRLNAAQADFYFKNKSPEENRVIFSCYKGNFLRFFINSIKIFAVTQASSNARW